MFGKKVKSWVPIPLKGFSGLLVFVVLFYLLTNTFFAFSGVSFNLIAYLFAGAVLILFPLLAYLFAKAIPELELRYEIHFIINLFIAILGLITTVDGHVTYAAAEQPLDTKAALFAFIIFLFSFIVGLVWSKLKWHKRFSKRF